LKPTIVYVTHDQIEAMTLADKIVVLRDGEVMQAGVPMDLYHNPANLFVAGFLGSPSMNFLDVEVKEANAKSIKVATKSLPALTMRGSKGFRAGQRATLGIRPQYLQVASKGKGKMRGQVILVERLGSETIVDVKLASGDKITAALPVDAILESGQSVALDFDPAKVHLFSETRT
jgi:multiple sugar transport system ATP-binding protein